MKINSNFLILNIYNQYIYKYNVNKFFFKFSLNNLNNTFFVFKKEKIYTKLKYSRVPQIDYVSGGVASLLAGLLGFLVTEKFGFELLDSLDFYILLYYIIFIFAVLRILYKTFISFGLICIFKTYLLFIKFIRILFNIIKK